MHASLHEFRGEAVPADSTAAVKASTYAFGLSALGKFILRLPSEVLEDELPRMRNTLTSVRVQKT
jgi:CLIP-associating protein 1/2